MSSKNLDFPFDQYSRQLQAAKLIDALRKSSETFKVLDVGGYKGKTAEFLDKDEVSISDIVKAKDKNYFIANGLNLPFDDNQFDFVVSFDVLEHIPEPKRHQFFDQCQRVAKRGVIIAAPSLSAANATAELSLNKLYKSFHKTDHKWLKEHIDNGLPDFDDLEKYANKKSWLTTIFPSNETTLWMLMQGAIFFNSQFDIAAEEIVKINNYYNQKFGCDIIKDRNNAYRLTLCCFKQKIDMQTIISYPLLLGKPVAEAERIDLILQIQRYHATLATKLNTLAGNFKELYDHALLRANTLQVNSEKLFSTINELNAEIAVLNSTKLRKITTSIKNLNTLKRRNKKK